MEIEYNITTEDLIAFSVYHFRNSPSSKRQVSIAMWSFIILILSIVLLIYVSGNRLLLLCFVFFSIIGGVLLFLGLPRYYEQNISKQLQKSLSEGKNNGVIGKQKLIITPEAVINETTFGNEKKFWNSMNKVAETSDYVFLYMSSTSGYVIPRSAFSSDEQRNSFLELVKQYYTDSTGQTLLIIKS